MEKIILKSIEIENFKGIQHFDAQFSDGKTSIRGMNASGKSTVTDAFSWLLFGKDSQGRSDFQIRPVDETGSMIDNIEILVEAHLEIADETGAAQSVVLSKRQNQNWVKKRGSSAPTFSGNTNTYEIDGFPVAQKDFDEKVSSIVEEKIFRLETNPTAFADLPWKEQRQLIVSLVPDVTDADIIALDEEKFAPIKDDVLAGGLERSKDKAYASLKRLKEEQKAHPIRIDEATRSIADVEKSEEELLSEKSMLETNLRGIQADRNGTANHSAEISSVNAEMMQVQSAMYDLERKATAELNNRTTKAYTEWSSANQRCNSLKDKLGRAGVAMEEIKTAIDQSEAEIAELTEKWRTIKGRVLPESETTCPTCGRLFETDKIEEIKREFEQRQKTDLDRVQERGTRLRAEISGMKQKLADFEEDQKVGNVKCLELMAEVEKLKGKYDKLAEAKVDVNQLPEYQEMANRQAELQQKLDALTASVKDGQKAFDEAEDRVRFALEEVNGQLATIESNKRLKGRIEALKAEQKECGQKVADAEQSLFLIEELTKLKMDTLSERINEKFSHVKFKLFETLINGAVKETCKMQIATNGAYVDYSNANTAGRIIGGLDVIDALAELSQVIAPIFIDNAECLDSHNQPESKAQLILLSVSEDRQLVVS